MKSLRITASSAVFILMAALALPVHSETLYVKDTIVLRLKNSPSANAPAVAYIRTGDKLESIREQDEYLLVQTTTGHEGWVLKRNTVRELPAVVIVKDLRENSDILKERVKQLESASNEVSEKLQQARAEAKLYKDSLTKVRKDYNDLAEMSGHVQSIAAERDVLKVQVRKLRDENSIFSQLGNTFANMNFLLWFLAGGSVLLIGWLIGRTSKRDRYY